MNPKLLIIGAGGHGRVVKEAAEAMGVFDSISFLDDYSEGAIDTCEHYKKYLNSYHYAFVALGDSSLRKKWMNKLTEAGYEIPAIAHPTAYISPSGKIGKGSFVGPKAVIHTNSIIERGCIIGIGALVDHDSYVGEYTYISAGAIVQACHKVNSFKKVESTFTYCDKCEYLFEVGV